MKKKVNGEKANEGRKEIHQSSARKRRTKTTARKTEPDQLTNWHHSGIHGGGFGGMSLMLLGCVVAGFVLKLHHGRPQIFVTDEGLGGTLSEFAARRTFVIFRLQKFLSNALVAVAVAAAGDERRVRHDIAAQRTEQLGRHLVGARVH